MMTMGISDYRGANRGTHQFNEHSELDISKVKTYRSPTKRADNGAGTTNPVICPGITGSTINLGNSHIHFISFNLNVFPFITLCKSSKDLAQIS
jgi:hypothetical protein